MNADRINNVASKDVAQATINLMVAVQDFDPAVQLVAVATMKLVMDQECGMVPFHVNRVADRVLHYHHDDPMRRAVWAYIREEVAKRV